MIPQEDLLLMKY